MATKQKLLGAAAGFGTDDPDFKYTTLLLDFDGTSGDNNNTFTDSSTNGHTITESGTVSQGSFSPYGDNWSNYFDNGSNTYRLLFADDASFDFGTGDFTVEAWINRVGTGAAIASAGYAGIVGGNTIGDLRWALYVNQSDNTLLWYGDDGVSHITTSTVNDHEWTHVAVSRSSSTLKIFINGVAGYSATVTTSYSIGSGGLSIARDYNANSAFYGYISNVRVVKGTGLYTSDFAPPTSPLTAVSGTSLLTCQSNRFIDNSTYSHTPTLVGSPKVTPFSPFERGEDRTLTADGGSGYWSDSDTSSLTFSGGPATVSDITISFWIYGEDFSQSTGNYFPRVFASGLYNGSPNGMLIYLRTDDVRIYFSGEVLQTPLNKFEWNYIVAQRSSGTWTLYKNGSSTGTSTTSGSTNIDLSTTNYIGSEASNGYITGYLSDFRITTSGSTSVAVPTSPVTAVTDTELLLNFQDAGIFDRTGINNLDTVGDARLGWAPIYGTGSLAFDGTGDSLDIEHKDELDLGTGDSTIEFWVSLGSGTPDNAGIISKGNGSANTGWQLIWNNTNEILFIRRGGSASSPQLESGNNTVYRDDTWHHVAVTTSGTTVRMFLNGTQVDSYTDTDSWDSTEVLRLGTNRGNANFIEGYLEDVRITKGVARYTSDFTPPTEIDLSTDTYREYVILFLSGEGPANGQNNTFTDSSTNDFTITETGSVVQGVFSPYGDNWSNYLDGTDYLYGTVNALGTGDFTLECWVNFSSLGANRIITSFGSYSPSLYYRHASTELAVYDQANGGAFYLSGFTPEIGEWYHVAFTRSGTTSRMFVNGVQQGSDTTYSTNITNTTLRIGYDGVDYTDAYISNVRVVSGTALYTSNFTAPTSPLSAVTNTEILTCQSNRFVDNGSNSIAVSINSTPKVSRFSPFESDKPYDITTDGGSGNLTVTGSRVYDATARANYVFGTGDFTLECWAYWKDGFDTYPRLIQFGQAWSTTNSIAWHIRGVDANRVNFWAYNLNTSSKIVGTSTPMPKNQWVHLAVTRQSGTFKIFMNGILEETNTSYSGSIDTASTNYVALGSDYLGSSQTNYNGYFSDARVVKGTALYTGNFTPPTAPLTAVTNTELLLNFQDSAIPDLSGLNNIDTVGDAKVAGSDPTKYGSNSLQLDGSGDDLRINVTDPISFSGWDGDFTAEMWVYPTAAGQSSNSYIWQHASSSTAYSPFIILQRPSTYEFAVYASSNGSSWNLISNATIGTATANAWSHIAVVRDGTNIKAFMNGTLGSTSAVSTTALMTTSGKICIGSALGYSNSYFTGFIDDLRITKGVARYTADFTPPIKALPKH